MNKVRTTMGVIRVLAFGILIVATSPFFHAKTAKAGESIGRPSILVWLPYISQARTWQEAWTDEMDKKGYRVQFLEKPEDLTWDLLSQFDVFVSGGFYYDWGLKVSPETLMNWGDLLPKFVKSGGGLLILNSIGGGYITKEQTENQWKTLYGEFGVRFLVEQVMDAEHSYTQTRRLQQRYSWTTNISKHPVTEGVKTIYYTTGGAIGYNPATAPLVVDDKDWQVLVRGMDTASSRAANWYQSHALDFTKELPGTYSSAPPIVAVRSYGKGRVAAVGLHYLICTLWQGHPLLDDILLSRGDGKTPSDTGKLLSNLYKWLAESSIEANRKYRLNTLDWGSEDAISWDKWGNSAIPEIRCAFPGLIGAHSEYSDGKGTVREWIEAAKKAGLKWIVFADVFEKLDKGKWDKLVEDCKKNSNEDFWAIPGIQVMDVGDNHWLQFGELPWLTPNILDSTGKKVKEAQNFKFQRGTPSSTPTAPTAPFLIKKNGHPAWSYRFLDIFAVWTAEKGKVVDDALDDYLVDQEQEDEVQPIFVNQVFSPAEISRKKDSIPVTYLYGPDAASARHWFREPAWRPGQSYVSSGPKLICWGGLNLSRSTLGAYYRSGTERWRIRLKVQADAGLKEIVIYDGTKPYVRYQPKGNEFDVSIDGLHDCSRRLVAVATDQKGGKLVTPSIIIVDFLGRTQLCGDRNNTMPISMVKGKNNETFYYGAATMVDKGRPPAAAMVTAMPSHEINLPGMDGGSSWKGYYPELVPAIHDWSCGAGYYPWISFPLVGRDFIVQKWDIANEFLPMDGHLRAILNLTPYIPFRPLEYFDMEFYNMSFVRRGGDIGLVLLEGTLTAKKPFVFDSDKPVSLPLVTIYPVPKIGENDHVLLFRPDQPSEALQLPESAKAFKCDGALPAGSYFMAYPDLVGSQGIFLLDDGYSARIEAYKERIYAQAYVSKPGQKMEKGDKISFRILCVLGVYNGPADNSEFELLRKSLGIACLPSYKTDLKQGKVAGTKLFLDLQTQDGGCVGKIKKTAQERFPCRLPVRVYGLNPNWSSAVYDRQRKELVPFGLMDGVGYTSLDLDQGEADVYIGNLATCDNPGMKLWVVEEGSKKVKVTVQNSTEKEIKTTVRIPEGYNRITSVPREVVVPAGAQIDMTVE